MIPLNRRQRSVLRLLIINIALLFVAILWHANASSSSVATAVAKSKQMMDMNSTAAPALDIRSAEQIALANLTESSISAGDSLELVEAVRMSFGEARYWRDQGCTGPNCAYVTFYDRTEGGTIEAIVNLEQADVVAQWANTQARPAGSSLVMPDALAIAAGDETVQAILGDIGAADPAMIPMSGWLMDDACSEEWCVDLTFHDPAGSGRIFHVFVNMEQEKVARTFYSRGRADRAAAKPVAQRNAYSDGCHEQYGWEVCWEMTADDGINFRDAYFDGNLIFSSAKIGQVEAWYPSWPGGYRDEIGFAATVPPFGDTVVNDLDDGFEVRQLFTEFTNWPNCICCYRYEERLRFYQDGRVEFHFTSHGPGCEDLSVYRPFWRIDIDLDGPDDDSVWLWEETAWSEVLEEVEVHPIVDDLSPEGQKLATFDGDLHYRWSMEETDPLGLDEGYFFLLQFDEREGAGPITTGPGDTYRPPRQWIDGEALSGENIVLWHVPLLKTKQGGPYWCQPDPEPAFSPCDAVLVAEPAAELRQPTAEELATLEATPEPTGEPAVSPTPTPTLAPTATPRPLEGREAEDILLNAGCTSCHQIGDLGEAHKVGPDLSGIGLTDSENLYGLPIEEYIRQSIVNPNAVIAANCPNGPCLPNIMPRDYETRLDTQQIETLVSYLLERKDESPSPVVLEPAVEISSTSAPKAFPAPKTAGTNAAGIPLSSTVAVQILLFTLVILVGLLLYFRGSKDDLSAS